MASLAPQPYPPQMAHMAGAQYLAQQAIGGHHMLVQMQVPVVGLGGMGWPSAPTMEYAYAQQPVQQPMQQAYYDPVSSFMQHLGIDPSEEHLTWIAELGLQSPLPPRWESCTDLNTGCTYYVDQDRHTSSWENPLLPHLRRIVELGRDYAQDPREGFFEDARKLMWQEQRDDLESWHGPFGDSQGGLYYVNSATGTTSCRDPREDAQYLYDLQSSFLSNLEEVLGSVQEPDTPGRHWGGNHGSHDPRRTAKGAQVLNLEEDSPAKSVNSDGGTSRAMRRLANLREYSKVDHRSTLQWMKQTADRLREACLEEEEVQRMRLAKLVEARKRRKKLKQQPPPLSLVELKLDPTPPSLPTDTGAAKLDGPSPMQGRKAPVQLQIDEEEGAGSSLGGRLDVPVAPPAGPPSPANFVCPPNTAPPMAPSTPADGAHPMPAVPSSPSLQRRSPGREWAAEAFLASKVGKRQPSKDSAAGKLRLVADAGGPKRSG